MALTLSERHGCVMQSEIRNMSNECRRVGGINLSQGVCDTPVPDIVQEGAREAIREGVNTYTHYAGLLTLREAVAQKQKRFSGINVDPESEIIVSAGATGALYCAFQALLNPGDEVILFEPFYGYHVSTLQASEAVPVYLPLRLPDWSFSTHDLEHLVTPRTKGIIVNTPANPSGKVFTTEELELIALFAERYDLFVFTDEIYEHFLYGGRTHHSFSALPGMKERTITVSGASKTFSVTGWRIGYALCDARWAQAIGYFNDLVYVCAPAPLQIGVAKGLLELGDDYYRALSVEYEAKRDLFCRALTRAGLVPSIPDGAYYVLADVSRIPGKSAKERAMHILRKSGVASVPASAFYHDGRGESMVRFCFAKEDAVLEEAGHRLQILA
ncbi:pyridoxal phosphate-dependent aminotransferase [Chlorobium sp. BLA1]|uniref:pyridoxal phosphate-dependent aminotransferase n=1 Tax=Candidatus Chlorobium masyuteum TaxID=2716876 RepID=UPI0014231ABF|nr:pyridoxal phosphate-dependent aminotransferase [Candidatus Chlorobium masyuteum]NHQ60793.1 pyridoxal phosphate-dependent aminotransferase [Candidatus Chlorobium masyuteum]